MARISNLSKNNQNNKFNEQKVKYPKEIKWLLIFNIVINLAVLYFVKYR